MDDMVTYRDSTASPDTGIGFVILQGDRGRTRSIVGTPLALHALRQMCDDALNALLFPNPTLRYLNAREHNGSTWEPINLEVVCAPSKEDVKRMIEKRYS